MNTRLPRLVFAAAVLAVAGLAGAQERKADAADAQQAQMPAWEQLTPAQRDLLVAPMRERWDANPGERARMYRHAERWRAMTPEQRARAQRGLGHWEHMDPARQREMRALFEKMRGMSKEQRDALREQWRAMSTAERRAWVEANPPKDAH